MATKIELVAEMDDGKTHTVVIDQRDFAKWEVQEEGGDVTRMRFLAWSAMTRQQLTTSTFKAFNETECVSVDVPEDAAEQEDEQGLDPGRRARTAGR